MKNTKTCEKYVKNIGKIKTVKKEYFYSQVFHNKNINNYDMLILKFTI